MTATLFCALLIGVPTAQALSPAQIAAVKDHYNTHGTAGTEAKSPDSIPAGVAVQRIDVSLRIRSASFGHATILIVELPKAGQPPTRYWVEYGRSTNTPAALYGPFTIPPQER
jgi:hypothetical protein